eukprot:CAMPEP_0118868708 /NCGR_PEP_ID=MMETSP1163-20130328/12188_1 /TAXON_ID=124430 /ORGANISM="Phaeomonas parva, Strain CCMP2877" /LENGTH=88 /DNA_ID=CAMNT_0006803465 /DNA_START=130 /DNA_END=393 /DNA_ORIENTATION=-
MARAGFAVAVLLMVCRGAAGLRSSPRLRRRTRLRAAASGDDMASIASRLDALERENAELRAAVAGLKASAGEGRRFSLVALGDLHLDP